MSKMFKNKLTKKSNKSYEDIQYSCTIRFLDDSEPLTVTFKKDTKGQALIDQVCGQLNLVEKDYFGLRYVDSEKQRHWLDPTKAVYRQLKNVHPMVLCFRCKFYPSDPMKLKEEITRYFVFLQLRRDLHHGRLLCSPADANLLAAYIIQSEVGDYDPEDHQSGYVAQFKMLPKQTQKQEEKIADIHKTLVGQVPSEAEANFLKKSCILDTYGVDPHPVKPKLGATTTPGYRDQKGNQMYLGVTHLGIVTFQGNKRTHLFKWNQITKIAFEGKMFIVHVTISEFNCIGKRGRKRFGRRPYHTGSHGNMCNAVKQKKHACGFKCPTFSACKHLWKCAVEQQYFFTLNASVQAPKVTSGGGFFTRGSKFHFSGRCQKEVYDGSTQITRDEPQFVRSSSNPNFVRSFNKLRSASLPSKLKDKTLSMGDVVPNNHVGLSDISLMSQTSDGLSLPVEESIPEEPAVELADTSYAPMVSPMQENLPTFPGASDGDGSFIGHQSPNMKAVSSDLDAEIQELQNELERCRAGDSALPNHYNEVPVDVLDATPDLIATAATPLAADEESSATEQQQHPISDNYTSDPESHAEADSAGQAPLAMEPEPNALVNQPGHSCCRILTLVFFVVFTFMLVMVFFVLESELDVPVLKDIRQMPEVQDFKSQHYDPFKTTVTRRMGGFFKR